MSFFHRSGKSDAARGTPGQPQHPELPRCAFCLKEQKDVRMLIAGPSVHICDACVGACVEIIAEDERLRNRSPRSSGGERTAARSQEAVACTLCAATGTIHDMLVIARRGVLCGACADAVDDALTQGRPEPSAG